ncbi:MAG: enoyl-CoA hydratase [Rhizobiales bacterium NRL2]|jgi:2-(1,2-epoxy-1,2-dihydrophenyl)acetyl-CoA isomerase|nr:MAG: enoyl-CoA hydratase [Rhizobiales bacterium NRL2]
MNADSATIAEGNVLLTIEDRVAHIRLNRPDAANGMSVELLRDFYDAVMAVHEADDVRAVLITGAGRNFCAGGDIRAFHSKGKDLPAYIRKATAYLQDAMQSLMRLDAPVIAAVQGYATGGGGFGMVCAVDLVVAAENAKFLAGATKVGMAPDAGTTATLPAIVGQRRATEILLLNPTMTAAEAHDLGIVNRVVPEAELFDAAMAMAKELAAGPPLAQAAVKREIRNHAKLPVEAVFTEEARTVAELSGTDDALEGLASMIERRPAKFTGR